MSRIYKVILSVCLTMEALKIAISAMWPDTRKERIAMILEPMQSMIQLTLLSYCPIGTKLSISHNLLCLQLPCWRQPVNRAINADKKDDLIFLFNVIARFHSFYRSLNESSDDLMRELFQTLIERAKVGLENLIRTYGSPDCAHLSQTLRLYVRLLEKPDDSNTYTTLATSCAEIDDVFKQVKEVYSQNDLCLLTYLLRMLADKPDQYIHYIDSVNNAMTPVNTEIRKWISNNIVY
jgi:hypothetical protein